MRLARIFTLAPIAFVMSIWPRFEVEDAVERLIEVLDTGDALLDDAAPEGMAGLGLPWNAAPPDAQA